MYWYHIEDQKVIWRKKIEALCTEEGLDGAYLPNIAHSVINHYFLGVQVACLQDRGFPVASCKTLTCFWSFLSQIPSRRHQRSL